MSKSSPFAVIHKGSFKNTEGRLAKLREHKFLSHLNEYGELGVSALSSATPVRTGKTAASWSYRIVNDGDVTILIWENSNKTRDGDNIVELLVRGHGTRNGSYVRGNDFVTPAIRPVFDEIAAKVSKEVTQ